MIGQDPGKRGNWYEEDYVVLQLLRLLSESTEAVRWEGEPEEGRGVDCWLTESGVRIAVQCKTRRGSNWTIKRLADRSVLTYCKEQLEKGDINRYRLVSDARCPDLNALIEKANTTEDGERWRRSGKKSDMASLMGHWTLEVDSQEDIAHAHSLVRRIELHQLSQSAIGETSEWVAGLLSPENPHGLLQVLLSLARGSLIENLCKTEIAEAVRRAGIRIEPRTYGPWVHDRLTELAKGFTDRIAEVRCIDLIERPETEKALMNTLEPGSGGSVLVHGSAGSGKSEVLAALVSALTAKSIPVLALKPDMNNEEISLGDDPIAALQAFAAGKPAVVVIDQLDQVLTSDQGVQRRLRRCADWLRRTRTAGLTAVVGCRTVDAQKDERLASLLTDASGKQPHDVFVGDLDEPTVSKVLASKGIALDDLSPQTRALSRRPICLRMMVGLVDAGGTLGNLRSEIEIVDRWWTELSRKLTSCTVEQAEATLDRLIDRMERDGLFSAPESGLDISVVDALCAAGVLARTKGKNVAHVRPVHQIITDVRMAQRWSDVRTFNDLLDRVGSYDSQSLHQARRLRFTVPLFVDQPGGIRILGDVLRSTKIRPLLKRAILLGVASITRPSVDLIKAVRDWFKDENLRIHVLQTVIHGNVSMIEALSTSGWLDETWVQSAADEELRNRLIGLLGSVADRWGDGVADHFVTWTETDPSILDQAHRVLTQQPGEDTDQLFSLRKEYIAQNAEYGRQIDWKALIHEHPHRAFELLAILLERTPHKELLKGWPPWSGSIRQPGFLPEADRFADAPCWNVLARWWRSLPRHLLEESWYGIDEDGCLHFLVELMALSLAGHFASEPGAWGNVHDELVGENRGLDAWLLLRTGAHLPQGAGKAADILASWLVANPNSVHLVIGLSGSRSEMQLAREFIRGIGDNLSRCGLDEVERWLLDFRDDWETADEKMRPDLLPNAWGLTAYRLFGELPESKLSDSAQQGLYELRRKFDGQLDHFTGEPKGGWMTSPIPDTVADRWSAQTWIRKIGEAEALNHSTFSAEWHEGKDGGIGIFTLEQISFQLERLAAATPRRYVDVARVFDASTASPARKAVLAGIAAIEAPRHYPKPETWEGLDDRELAEILVRSEYLEESKFERRLAWIIDKRPTYNWPDPVIARLTAIARGPTSAGMSLTDDFGLLGYRMNETACSSMHALGELARHQPERRAEVLKIAASLVNHEDPGRQAAAASASISCYEHDRDTAVEVFLQATLEPRIAAEPDLIRPLLWLVIRGDDAKVREQALARILAIADYPDEHISARGGGAAVALRVDGAIDDGALGRLLDRSAGARRGAAREVGAMLRKHHVPDWLLELTLRLADDEDKNTADAVVHGIAYGHIEDFVRNGDFFSRLLGTRAGEHQLSTLIEGCDRAARLLPVADQVIEMAMKASRSAADTVEYWRRYEGTRRAVNALARLVEEAEEESSFEVRRRALDAWDALIEEGEPVAAHSFDKRITDV